MLLFRSGLGFFRYPDPDRRTLRIFKIPVWGIFSFSCKNFEIWRFEMKSLNENRGEKIWFSEQSVFEWI